MRTSNPAFKEDTFAKARAAAGNPTETMTVNDTVNKIGILLLIATATASWSWGESMPSMGEQAPTGSGLFMGAGILGFIIALATIFKQTWAPVTAPLYAAVQGVFLGAISAYFEIAYPGIAMQAAFGTLATLGAMLFCYKTGIIRATEKFRTGVFAATGGIMGLYFLSMILGMFGIQVPMIHEGGMMGIGFSLFVVGLAALNLILDFDNIEMGERARAPKYMEWYGAFSIMVTLVWLYMEMLRLLSKLRGDD
jgi:uncharacterized YccA/Bax inhibitor family protein